MDHGSLILLQLLMYDTFYFIRWFDFSIFTQHHVWQWVPQRNQSTCVSCEWVNMCESTCIYRERERKCERWKCQLQSINVCSELSNKCNHETDSSKKMKCHVKLIDKKIESASLLNRFFSLFLFIPLSLFVRSILLSFASAKWKHSLTCSHTHTLTKLT